MDKRTRVTEIVAAIGDSEPAPGQSSAELVSVVYDELRRLARSYLSRERPEHTLQPTALVHEAFLRLVDDNRVTWNGRAHFLAVGARAMRHVLVDYARRRRSRKRGGDRQRVTLAEELHGAPLDLDDVLALDRALGRLAEIDERQERVVELRFFGGFSVDETARLLEVSKRTVEGDWTHARAWLRRELSREEG